MFIKRKRGWELPESAVTPEPIYRRRRQLIKALAAGPILAVAAPLIACEEENQSGAKESGKTRQTAEAKGDPTADLYPVERNDRFVFDRAITDEDWVTGYNNFYEFGSHKEIAQAAQALPRRPWQVRFDGMVEEEKTVDIDTLIREMSLEERVYSHRCVEAWSFVAPWSGFPMRDLVAFAKPLSSARYVMMQSFQDPSVAPGQRQSWLPWPYTEGLTMEEATHELAFMVTGAYGEPMESQNGAPLRLAVPWKYGFKHIKSIVRFTFTDKQPSSFWEDLQGNEYGFWANVNPEVPHPRWSQAEERVLGTGGKVPTQLYNGYAEFVADLYADKKEKLGERLYR